VKDDPANVYTDILFHMLESRVELIICF
jgi:hypothetical protein